MRLLLTRPEDEAVQSKKKLEDMGHEVISSPLLEITFSNESLKSENALAVTSKNALKALQGFSNFHTLLSCPIFCVGDATAKLAREIGFQSAFSASGTVDNLVSLIASNKINTITYVCGRERKGNLEGKLALRGIDTVIAERYQADFSKTFSPLAEKVLKDRGLDGVLFYSTRSAKAYLSLLERYKISYSTNFLTYFCLAKGIANVFDNHDKERIVVAEHPNEESLFQLLA